MKRMADDPASAAAEYGAEFRTDVESFVSRKVINAATIVGRFELPYVATEHYIAFVDPSGGSADSMTMAIAHQNQWCERAILGCRSRSSTAIQSGSDGCRVCRRLPDLRRRPSPRRPVCRRVAARSVSQCRRQLPAIDADQVRNIFLAVADLESSRCELFDNERLRHQLIGLERKTARGGRDSIDHGPGSSSHDDLINAAAGALVLASHDGSRPDVSAVGVDFHGTARAQHTITPSAGWLGQV